MMVKKMKRFFLAFCMLLASIGMFAQEAGKIIGGTVLDESNSPLTGVVVRVNGSTVATTTGIDGDFQVRLPSKHSGTLTFQILGYEDKTVQIGKSNNIRVQMTPDAINIEEAVVYAGYGTMRKSDITGSVTSVRIDPSDASRATSFDQLLTGHAAGVAVVSGNAAPGGAVKIRVRGTSSLRGDNEPLYVVDGSIIQTDDIGNPLTSYGSNKGNTTQATQNPLSLINPQDIESIEVLKDASATAIYGSQGANGVVLITTKQAGRGTAQVNYTGTFTLSTLSRSLDLLSLEEYADFRNLLYEINGNTEAHFDPTVMKEVDWQKEMLKPVWSQVHRISINGRSKGTSYYVAAGISDRNGLIRKTGLDQQDLRVNITHDVNSWLSLKSNTLLARQVNDMTTGIEYLGNRSIIYQILAHGPFDGDHDEDGNLDEFNILESPITWLDDYDDKTVEYRVNTALTLDARILKWLTWSNKLTVDLRKSTRSRWYGLNTSTGRESNGQASLAHMGTFLYNVESMFQVNKKFGGNHSISGTAGVVFNDRFNESDGAVGENFANYLLRADGIASAQQYYPLTFGKTSQQLFSALARVIYNYRDRYILTATFRADASSKFNAGNKWAYFPSFAAAWRVSEEPFMSGVSAISNLKLRAGWGQVGNQAVAPYQTLPLYNKNSYAEAGNTGIITGYIPGNLANPLLKWETSEQANLGLDLGLLNGRISLSVDAYIKNTKDLLQQFNVPSSSGFDRMWLNRGRIQNKGIEITVDSTPVKAGDFMWTLSGNISFNRNRIVFLGMEPTNIGNLKDVVGYLGSTIAYGPYLKCPGNAFLEGYPLGVFFGYETAG